MAIKVYKFREIQEMQDFLQGAIIGGAEVTGGVYAVGKTLVFNNPSATVTFTQASLGPGEDRDKNRLLPKDLHAQIQAAVAGVTVSFLDRRLVVIESTPSSGVNLDATGTANALLGFDTTVDTVGKVYDSPYSSPPVVPYFVQAYSNNDNVHVVLTEE